MLPASKKPTLFGRFRCWTLAEYYRFYKTCSGRNTSAQNSPWSLCDDHRLSQTQIGDDPCRKARWCRHPCEEFEEAWPPLAWSAYLLREQHLVLGQLVCGTYAAPNTIF